MKTFRVVCLVISMLAVASAGYSQIPQGFNYQGVLRDNSGNEISGTEVTVKFRIIEGTESGQVVWEEDHPAVTNEFGLFNLVIGTGSRSGGAVLQFSDIQWQENRYYLEVSIFYQGAWHDFAGSQLYSVPYASKAGSALDNPFINLGENVALIDRSLSIGSPDPGGSRVAIISQDDLSEEALFEVKRSDGQSVFAVYSDGVQINIPVDPLLKGPRGGFAIGGFDKTKGIADQFMVITSDSTRIYIDDTAVKGPSRGGFAIGGFDRTKAYRQDYISVTPDSTRVYVENQAKGPRGGFAIGGFDRTKGLVENFLDLTPENYFIGHKSGRNNVSGLYNSFVGYETGLVNYSGSANALFGFQAGYMNTAGSGNLFLGYQSGYSNADGNYNSFMGYLAGYSNTSGNENAFLGSYSGTNNTSGSNNTFAGYNSGYSNKDGSSNNFFGTGSGYSNTSGSNNVFIGPESGYFNSTGLYNVYIGYRAGYKGTDAYSNVCIGNLSGSELTLAYQNVFIGHMSGSNTTWGESNVFVGNSAGLANITGGSNVIVGAGAGEKSNASNNTFVGWGTGFNNLSGQGNTFIGLQSGFNNTSGNDNLAIGNGAGYGNKTGSGNIFIGKYAGFSEMGSNKLYIDNSSTTTPLIYGDFSTNNLRVNGNLGLGVLPSGGYRLDVAGKLNLNRGGLTGVALAVDGAEALWFDGTYFSYGYGGTYNYFSDKVTIGSPGNYGYMLYVQGSAYATGTWYSSDIRFKKEIEEIADPLAKILKMKGVSYLWKTDEFADRNFPAGRHFGVIAQEIETVLPEVVNDGTNGEKSVAYNELIPVLIEAVKEQQKTIELQQKENESMRLMLMQLNDEISNIKATMALREEN